IRPAERTSVPRTAIAIAATPTAAASTIAVTTAAAATRTAAAAAGTCFTGALALFTLRERKELAAREADLAVALDADDLHVDFFAFLQDVGRVLHAVV